MMRGGYLKAQNKLARFEQATLSHMDAAYNLARWLTGNDQDAEDVVQEAYLRAFKFFDSFQGENSRTWVLSIVRNTCYTWLRQNRHTARDEVFDEDIHSENCDTHGPEQVLLETMNREMLEQALNELPVEFRETMILRELEGLSYKEIALISRVPLGTVMSRLARARERLQKNLSKQVDRG
jgi:RNA polymerase sigma-70 factor (ECF subfamily)